MDPVSMIRKTEELAQWASKLLQAADGSAGGHVDPDEFEKFRANPYYDADALEQLFRHKGIEDAAGQPIIRSTIQSIENRPQISL